MGNENQSKRMDPDSTRSGSTSAQFPPKVEDNMPRSKGAQEQTGREQVDPSNERDVSRQPRDERQDDSSKRRAS